MPAFSGSLSKLNETSGLNYIGSSKITDLVETQEFKFDDNSMTSDHSPTSSYHSQLDDSVKHSSLENITHHQSSLLQFDWPNMEDLSEIFSNICSIAVIFGGLAPYVPQYIKVKQLENCDGFSTYVCLTLLLANLLRIMFWFGHPFETPLLIQSFIMIAGMIAMMEICIRTKKKNLLCNIPSTSDQSKRLQRRHRHGRSPTGKLTDIDDQNQHDSEDLNGDITSGQNSSTHGVGQTQISSEQSEVQIDGQPTILPEPPNDTSQTSANQFEIHLDSVSESSDTNLIETTASKYHDTAQEIVGIENSDSNINDISDLESQNPARTTTPLNGINGDAEANRGLTITRKPKSLLKYLDFWARNFWQWDNYMSYVIFIALFTIPIGVVTFLLIDNHLYVESLGFVAVLTESMLGMPQLAKNFHKKSTLGMSVEMVVMWLSGDIFKTVYFLVKKTPTQFYICGSIQVVVDILILGQVVWYRSSRYNYLRLPKEMAS